MEEICTDSVFGKMSYRHRWYKKEKILLFGKSWVITTAAQAYHGQDITDEERHSYQYIQNNWGNLQLKAWEAVREYVLENIEDIAEYWPEIHQHTTKKAIAELLLPKTLLFQRNGFVILLLDCQWNIESGLGIQLYPKIEVAEQDVFL